MSDNESNMNPKPAKLLSGTGKIAVLRANAIGDFIFTLPALQALRDTYPGAEIVLLGQPWHAEFMEGRPGPVDRVIAVPGFIGLEGPPRDAGETETLDRFFDRLRAEEFEAVFQLFGGGRFSNPYVKRMGARMTIGLRAPEAEPLDLWIPYVYFQPEILRYLEVVSLAGARTDDVDPHLAVTKGDLEESYQVLEETGTPLVIINAGAGDVRRRWLPERFARVADALSAEGVSIALTGTSRERAAIDEIVEKMQAPAANLCDMLSLRGYAGLAARSALVIANDSGPLHLAKAVGAPTIGIYWGLNLVTATHATRLRHRPLVSWKMNCSICGRNLVTDPCQHEDSLVDQVTVDEVLETARELLATSSRKSPLLLEADSHAPHPSGSDRGADGASPLPRVLAPPVRAPGSETPPLR